MSRFLHVGLIAGLWSVVPAAVAADCQLCAVEAPKPVPQVAHRPIQIEIDSALDFSLSAHQESGEGTIEVDSHSGTRRVSGGLIGLGGPAIKGVVRITGDPFARIKIDFPRSLELRSSGGATATISDIRTTLSADPMIGSTGELIFSFGARMTVNGGAAGDFQGRFPISADYQ